MQENSQRNSNNVVIGAVLLLAVCCFLGYELYNAKVEIKTQSTVLENTEAELDGSKLEKLELDYKIKELNRDIINLEDDIQEYQYDILEYEEEKKLNEEKFSDLQSKLIEKEQQLSEIYAKGGTEDNKNFINELTTEIERLRSREIDLVNKNNLLVTQNEEIKQAFKNVSRELEFIKKERIQYLEDKVQLLTNEKRQLETLNRFSSISAMISEIGVSSKSNEIGFKLIFDSEEINLLRSISPNFLTLVPTIYNESQDIALIPTTRGELNRSFQVKISELSESISLKYRIDNIDLSKAYKKNPVNLSKGDRINLSIRLVELSDKEISNAVFYLK